MGKIDVSALESRLHDIGNNSYNAGGNTYWPRNSDIQASYINALCDLKILTDVGTVGSLAEEGIEINGLHHRRGIYKVNMDELERLTRVIESGVYDKYVTSEELQQALFALA